MTDLTTKRENKRPRRKRGQNKAELVFAGIIEFAKYGYHGTSTGRIAARAEVSQPHMYTNFKSKQELFTTCAKAVVDCLCPTKQEDSFGGNLISADMFGAEHNWQLISNCFIYNAYAACASVPEIRSVLTQVLGTHRAIIGDAALSSLLTKAALAMRNYA